MDSATTSSVNGRGTTEPQPRERSRPPVVTPAAIVSRPRNRPRIILGVFLVVGFALGFAVVTLHASGGKEVLAVVRPVAAGHVLTAADLETVRLTAGSGIQPVLASMEQTVVGESTAVPLVAGSLLSPGDLGSASRLTAGQDVVALGLKPGQYPPALTAGDHVDVVPVASGSSSSPSDGTASSGSSNTGSLGAGSGSSGSVPATVVSVDAAPSSASGVVVISLQVRNDRADGVAALAAAGSASLIQLPPSADMSDRLTPQAGAVARSNTTDPHSMDPDSLDLDSTQAVSAWLSLAPRARNGFGV